MGWWGLTGLWTQRKQGEVWVGVAGVVGLDWIMDPKEAR